MCAKHEKSDQARSEKAHSRIQKSGLWLGCKKTFVFGDFPLWPKPLVVSAKFGLENEGRVVPDPPVERNSQGEKILRFPSAIVVEAELS